MVREVVVWQDLAQLRSWRRGMAERDAGVK